MNAQGWLGILKVLAPVILNLIPQIPKPLIPVITEAIGAAEQSGQTGPEKLTSVVSHPALSNVEVPVLVGGVNKVIAAVNAVTQ